MAKQGSQVHFNAVYGGFGGGATTTAGFGVVVGHEDFTADPPTHISIKPEESDLNNCYISEFESYSQKYLKSVIYIAVIIDV